MNNSRNPINQQTSTSLFKYGSDSETNMTYPLYEQILNQPESHDLYRNYQHI